ncbi:dialkylresorcinol condensing enzyme DarA [Cellulophaga sp. E16_2]|uniref:dialkylrecorsinol condensing enzyme DarA n=1 Tax=unclassified Cellulophaga TaxID=2634405 RepID=UPI0013FE175D|nr:MULTISPECIES: dialkylrecorsinol condensing enzyme DarA [unclassified Cellulophaga]MBO0591047.1 dialkylresorcinol condensing enzyme DarA [Cellulophaga sp. E16_2]
MKNILVLHYSQSGQLTEIVNNIATPLGNDKDINVVHHQIKMEIPFAFPWKKKDFFNVFPETFLQIPSKIKKIPENILNQKFDLVILGYSVWYLSPSIPATSFLKSDDAKKLLANTPVITVIGCRNMWIMAQEKIKKLLKGCNSKLVGNIVLVDRHINHISVITIVQWMFTGKKEHYLGIFPKPGVSQKDIDASSKFGNVILDHINNNKLKCLQNNLIKEKAVVIKPFLVVADKRANILFSKWAKLIRSKGKPNDENRTFWLRMFNLYLLFVIWIIAPLVFILFLFTYFPLYGKIKKDKNYYSSVEIN